MSVAVRTNVTTYATTHVATNMLRSLKQIIQGCGLDPARLMAQWALLENGVATWLASGHLQALVLEVFDPSDRVDDRRGRFDFTIDPTDDVRAYLAAARLPIGTLATLTPAAGAGNQAIAGPGHAVAVALAVRDEVRRLARATGAQRLHLFLACPGGLALLLGHWWNRVPTTQLYEDLGAGRGYTPAFLLGF